MQNNEKENQISIRDELTEFLLYSSPDGEVKVEVFLHNENIWLPQKRIAELFGTTKQNIGNHLKNIFDEGELLEKSVVKNFFTTAEDGKSYNVKSYTLDAIISVGYRVNSSKATQFRIWATKLLKEDIIKGFVMDDKRLKNVNRFFTEPFRFPMQQDKPY